MRAKPAELPLSQIRSAAGLLGAARLRDRRQQCLRLLCSKKLLQVGQLKDYRNRGPCALPNARVEHGAVFLLKIDSTGCHRSTAQVSRSSLSVRGHKPRTGLITNLDSPESRLETATLLFTLHLSAGDTPD